MKEVEIAHTLEHLGYHFIKKNYIDILIDQSIMHMEFYNRCIGSSTINV